MKPTKGRIRSSFRMSRQASGTLVRVLSAQAAASRPVSDICGFSMTSQSASTTPIVTKPLATPEDFSLNKDADWVVKLSLDVDYSL